MNKPADVPQITPTPARLSTEDIFPHLGCVDILTPRGKVHCHDAPGFMTTLIDHPTGEKSVGLLIYDPDSGTGMLAQASACNARVLADSLMRIAIEIDGGKVDS